jgi:transcriptional accessory protein Tex/SPT6
MARQEFPDLDLTVRGAISIARRLQDPLAELVKVDPKSIGVGQYQHDVDQRRLKQSLEATVESCVNRVGVDLNTASWALLRYVAGITERTATSTGNSARAWTCWQSPASAPRHSNRPPAFSASAAAKIRWT